MTTLYIIGSSLQKPVKIGVSTSVATRLKSVQTHHHHKLSLIKKWELPPESAYRIETLAHTILGQYRMEGEWFNCGVDKAVDEIDSIMRNTANGKSLEYYSKLPTFYTRPKSSQLAAKASADRKKATTKEAVAKIKDRWPLPSKEWPTKALLDEAGISLNTAKSHLGKRPIAQYNYQAAQKRKARKENVKFRKENPDVI